MKNYEVISIDGFDGMEHMKKLGWEKSIVINGPLGGNYLFYKHKNGEIRMIAGNALNSRAMKSAYKFVVSKLS